LSSPIVIHVLRPYENEDEYLAHEHASIDAKTMLLIDQPALPLETAIVFDVQLTNGHKPIRAEARVVAHVTAQGADPGGLRVRFKRFGTATKAFIDRAVALSGPVNATSLTPAAPPVQVNSRLPSSGTAPASEGDTAPGFAPSLPSATDVLEPHEASGVHRKSVAPVPAPANREALLARLRGRLAS
jgi:hypothetical protein